MRIQPCSLISNSSSSTAVVAEFLSRALDLDIDATTLRNTYQSHFQALLKIEYNPIDFLEIERVLDLFQQSFRTVNNQTIADRLQTPTDHQLKFVVIQGAGTSRLVDFGASPEEWVKQGIAEPGIIEVLQRQRVPESTLLALAAGAECAPTRAWLDAGGTVIAVMRQHSTRWLDIINYARQSAGKLIIPLKNPISDDLSDGEIARAAGIDLVEDFEILPEIVEYSVNQQHTVIGAYAYSPGATHLIVQAVQDAIIDYASKRFTVEQVAFHWLATPTDSQLVSKDFYDYAKSRYEKRSPYTKIRDIAWGIFGQLREPRAQSFGAFTIVDSSVQKQGFNYQIAKRTQRLRALHLFAKGFHVAYSVTPPATTDSVLSHRILIASYRGAPRFGLQPFDKDLIGPIAMQQCLHTLSIQFSGPHEVYSRFAVHGGLWRLGYDPKTVWIPATISGLLALFLPLNRAFRSVSLTKR